jgi:hypothetical protein
MGHVKVKKGRHIERRDIKMKDWKHIHEIEG